MAWLCSGIALVAACQGAAASDLFDPNIVIDASVPTDAPATSNSSGGDTDASQTSSSGGASSSGAPDAAPDAPVADLDLGVFCSGAVGYCNAPLVCCAGRAPTGALGPYGCKAACAATETTLPCDDKDDCGAGEVCCSANNGAGVPQTVECKATAACPPTVSQGALCDPSKPDPCAAYSPGFTCQPFRDGGGNDFIDQGYLCQP